MTESILHPAIFRKEVSVANLQTPLGTDDKKILSVQTADFLCALENVLQQGV